MDEKQLVKEHDVHILLDLLQVGPKLLPSGAVNDFERLDPSAESSLHICKVMQKLPMKHNMLQSNVQSHYSTICETPPFHVVLFSGDTAH